MNITTTSTRWFTHTQPKPHSRLRLFCFPCAGGSASAFRPWFQELPSSVELIPIQPPGRENRIKEQPLTQVMSCVEILIDVMQPYLDKPFAFLGHSLGARVSFELARSLQQYELPMPKWLFVAGNPAPQRASTEKPIYQLPDEEFLSEIRRYNGTSEDVLNDLTLMRFLLPMLRADFEMYDTYTYTDKEPLDCPISVFGGSEDHKVSYEDLSAWKVQTRNTFSIRMLPGDHFFLHNKRSQFLPILMRDLIYIT